MKTSTKLIWTFAVAAVLAAGPVLAADDGDLGATSTGTSNITLTTTERAQITDIEDAALGTYDTEESGIDTGTTLAVCIYTNDPAGEYEVTATGDYESDGSAGDNFFIKRADPATDTIAYTVKWSDTVGDTASNSLDSGVQDPTVFDGASSDYPCSVENANFRIELTHNDIMSKPAGVYSGVLSIEIAPNNA